MSLHARPAVKKRAGGKLDQAGQSIDAPKDSGTHTGFQSAGKRPGKPESKSAAKNTVCSAIVAEETPDSLEAGTYGLIAQPVRAHA